MPIDLPPNLQNVVTPIVRAAEQTNANLPGGDGGQEQKKRKREAGDGVNARNADKNSSSKQG